jgi:hypothetical protein
MVSTWRGDEFRQEGISRPGQEWCQYDEEMNSIKEEWPIQIENDINTTGKQIPQ